MRGPDHRQHHRPARVAAAAALWAAALAPGAAAAPAPQPAQLPSPATGLTAEPPLAGSAAPLLEIRLPGRVDASTRVLVRQTRAGDVVAVSALQRLVVRGRGDYSFAVPAPVRDVRVARGSESEPGLRTDAVLWQGFSSGRRTLAAALELEPARVARLLPLELRVVREGPRVHRLTIRNVTTVRVASYSAAAVGPTIVRALDSARRAVAAGRMPTVLDVAVRPPVRRRSRRAGALLAVDVAGRPGTRLRDATGGLRVDAAGTGAHGELVPGASASLVLESEGTGFPDAAVTARPLPPVALLQPRPGSTWATSGLDGTALLDRALDAFLAVARTRQYERFVAAPDPAGRAGTSFRYELVAAAPAAPGTAAPDGDSPLPELAVVALLAAALVAAIITWAHS